MISNTFTQSCLTVSLPVASMLMTRFVLGLLHKAARNTQAGVDDGTAARVATYPIAVRALAWGMLVVGVAGAVVVAGYNATHGAVFTGLAIAVVIISVIAATVAEFTRVRVEWTDTNLQYNSPWSAPRRVTWEDIVEVTYSQTANWFVVRDRDGAKIRLPHLLGGLGDLFDEMKRRGSDELRGQIERVTAGALKRRSAR